MLPKNQETSERTETDSPQSAIKYFILRKICRYDPLTHPRTKANIHNHRGSFLVKNKVYLKALGNFPFTKVSTPLLLIPGKRGNSYLEHLSQCWEGENRVPEKREVHSKPSWVPVSSGSLSPLPNNPVRRHEDTNKGLEQWEGTITDTSPDILPTESQ